MATKQKDKFERKAIKRFCYSKGGISLDFSLNIENKQELETFMEFLVAGEKDVRVEIARLA